VFSFEGPGCSSLLDCFLFDFDLQFFVLLPFGLFFFLAVSNWPEKVVRKDTEVVCPHCKQQWKLRNILLYFLISCWLFNIDNYLNCILYSNTALLLVANADVFIGYITAVIKVNDFGVFFWRPRLLFIIIF
jgi:hypothetical protein